ncbi:hypothetical protein CEXT_104031 [Caerostris extrusa]|uniref:DUF5641 domain-containing protein n=1 Tax=Caerostris extrusa TaxID=172846 RepID=A0AAV4N8F4_CAEEX|nr:hypothetical protein CEXT_104031 [Caerostris extrusa]
MIPMKLSYQTFRLHPRHKELSETMDLDIVDAKCLRKRIRYLQNHAINYVNDFRRNIYRAYSESSHFQNDVICHQEIVVLVGSDNTKRLNWPFKGVSSNPFKRQRQRRKSGEIACG